jgi:hypothetical protein
MGDLSAIISAATLDLLVIVLALRLRSRFFDWLQHRSDLLGTK